MEHNKVPFVKRPFLDQLLSNCKQYNFPCSKRKERNDRFDQLYPQKYLKIMLIEEETISSFLLMIISSYSSTLCLFTTIPIAIRVTQAIKRNGSWKKTPSRHPPALTKVLGKARTPTPVIDATIIAVAGKNFNLLHFGSPISATDSWFIQDVTEGYFRIFRISNDGLIGRNLEPNGCQPLWMKKN